MRGTCSSMKRLTFACAGCRLPLRVRGPLQFRRTEGLPRGWPGASAPARARPVHGAARRRGGRSVGSDSRHASIAWSTQADSPRRRSPRCSGSSRPARCCAPMPPMPTTAMLTRSLGGVRPWPSTCRGTIMNPAAARPVVATNSRRVGGVFGVDESAMADADIDVTNAGVQIHGGMGFMSETAAAQFYLDARITPIYEGTNGIQAIDLVGRKLSMNNGAAMTAMLGDVRETVREARSTNQPRFVAIADRLDAAADALDEATQWMIATMKSARETALSGADELPAPGGRCCRRTLSHTRRVGRAWPEQSGCRAVARARLLLRGRHAGARAGIGCNDQRRGAGVA